MDADASKPNLPIVRGGQDCKRRGDCECGSVIYVTVNNPPLQIPWAGSLTRERKKTEDYHDCDIFHASDACELFSEIIFDELVMIKMNKIVKLQ